MLGRSATVWPGCSRLAISYANARVTKCPTGSVFHGDLSSGALNIVQRCPCANAVLAPLSPVTTWTGSTSLISPTVFDSRSTSALVSVPSWFPSSIVTAPGSAATALASAPSGPSVAGFAAMMSASDGGRVAGGYVQTSNMSPSRTSSRIESLCSTTHSSAVVRYGSWTAGWYQTVGAPVPM